MRRKFPILSIVIPSLASRSAMLEGLVRRLGAQARADEVEVLTAVDSGLDPTGSKRNRLVSIARGAYVVHIDDDDQVHPAYIPKILAAIESKSGVDVVLVRGCRMTVRGGMVKPGSEVIFDFDLSPVSYRYKGAIWTTPGHLCPMRTELAKAVPFREITWGEDAEWMPRIGAHLQTSVRAGAPGEILYEYLWDDRKG